MRSISFKKKLDLFLISILPLSIITGPSISLLNIILINLVCVIYLYKEKMLYIFDNTYVKFLLILYLYLILNTFISLDHKIGLGRNLGFLRFIGLFIFINYLFFKNENLKKVIFFWFLIISLTIFDVFVEYFLGKNIFGWGDEPPNIPRVVSFFKDEHIVGAFLIGFYFILLGYLLDNFKNRGFLILIFSLILLISVFVTGERSNFIRLFIGLLIIFSFLDYLKIQTKIILTFLISLILILIINQSEYLKVRYFGQLISNFSTKEKIDNYIEKSVYFNLYKSGIKVFKKYPYFGVGNKNYRVETCDKKKSNSNYWCATHPHQLYIEFLSEHGLFGTIILLGIIFMLMFKILICIFSTKNYTQIGSFIYLVIVFIPVLPSGSFFSDFNSTIFWLNLSIMFACSKKTNIFEKN